MSITKAEWEAAVTHLKATLGQFSLSPELEKEIRAFIESLKQPIVEKDRAGEEEN